MATDVLESIKKKKKTCFYFYYFRSDWRAGRLRYDHECIRAYGVRGATIKIGFANRVPFKCRRFLKTYRVFNA